MSAKRIRLIISASLTITLTANVLAGEWATTAPMPVAVQEIYPLKFAEHLLVVGGISDALPVRQGQMTGSVQRYTSSAGAWQSLPALPEGRHHVYPVLVDDTLFVFGGFVLSAQGQWTNSADVLRLNPKQTHWEKVAEMPISLSETVGAVVGGKVHLAGGRSAQAGVNGEWQHSRDNDVHLVFDPVSLQFSRAAPLPSARNSAATVQIGERWLVIGGRVVGGSNLREVIEYLPASDRWQRLADLPEGRAGHAAAVLENSVYVFGGEWAEGSQEGVHADVLALDLHRGDWQIVDQMPHPRHGLGAVAVNGKIYLLGGAGRTGLRDTQNRVDVYTP